MGGRPLLGVSPANLWVVRLRMCVKHSTSTAVVLRLPATIVAAIKLMLLPTAAASQLENVPKTRQSQTPGCYSQSHGAYLTGPDLLSESHATPEGHALRWRLDASPSRGNDVSRARISRPVLVGLIGDGWSKA